MNIYVHVINGFRLEGPQCARRSSTSAPFVRCLPRAPCRARSDIQLWQAKCGEKRGLTIASVVLGVFFDQSFRVGSLDEPQLKITASLRSTSDDETRPHERAFVAPRYPGAVQTFRPGSISLPYMDHDQITCDSGFRSFGFKATGGSSSSRLVIDESPYTLMLHVH